MSMLSADALYGAIPSPADDPAGATPTAPAPGPAAPAPAPAGKPAKPASPMAAIWSNPTSWLIASLALAAWCIHYEKTGDLL